MKLQICKQGLEWKDHRINLANTKVSSPVSRMAGKSRLCATCRSNIGMTSVKFTQWIFWIPWTYTSINRKFTEKIDFMWVRFTGAMLLGNAREMHPSPTRMYLEIVGGFCYVADKSCSERECSESMAGRKIIGWANLGEFLLLLASNRLTLRIKGRVNDACIRTAMLQNCESWTVTAETICKYERN